MRNSNLGKMRNSNLDDIPEDVVALPGEPEDKVAPPGRPQVSQFKGPPLPAEPTSAGACLASGRFHRLLQELSDEYNAVTNALCEELRVAKGSGTADVMASPPTTGHSTEMAGARLQQQSQGRKSLGQQGRTSLGFDNQLSLRRGNTNRRSFFENQSEQGPLLAGGIGRDFKVVIAGASDLCSSHGNSKMQEAPDTYCTCHWQSRPQMQWNTPTAAATFEPSWHHSFIAVDSFFDDDLNFVVSSSSPEPQTLGSAYLSVSAFCLNGFEGSLPLQDAGGRSQGELFVKISVASVPQSAPVPVSLSNRCLKKSSSKAGWSLARLDRSGTTSQLDQRTGAPMATLHHAPSLSTLDRAATMATLERSLTKLEESSTSMATLDRSPTASMPTLDRSQTASMPTMKVTQSSNSWYVGRTPCASWKVVVRRLLDAGATDLRKPRDIWMKSITAPDKVLAVQATQRLSTVDVNRKTFLPTPSRRIEHSSMHAFVHFSSDGSHWTIVMDPHSKKRLSWAVLGMMFILYDFLMVPMQAFPLKENSALEVIKWVIQVFWTLDIFVNFITAVYVQSHLDFRLFVVARVYAKSWLGFDLLVTLPGYLPIFTGAGGQMTEVGRTMRLLRFMRLLRLAKFRKMYEDALEVINDPRLLLAIGLTEQLFALILWNHVIACMWFGLGDAGIVGWTRQERFQDAEVLYSYLSALHWVLSQYQGTSEILPESLMERAFAVGFLQVAIIILALFLSTITNLMRQLQDLQHDRHSQQRSVRDYLNNNDISQTLSMRVKKYVDWQLAVEAKRNQDDRILLVLPISILMDLMVEVRQPIIAKHPFFGVFCTDFQRISRRMCHEATSSITPAPGETVFAPGDDCNCMYWVRQGTLRYVANPGSVSKVLRQPEIGLNTAGLAGDLHLIEGIGVIKDIANAESLCAGFWISEAVLWTHWEHCGELVGLEDCSLLVLEFSSFGIIAASYRPALTMASIYARRFVVGLEAYGRCFTDLIDHLILFDDEEPPTRQSFRSIRQTAGNAFTGMAKISKNVGVDRWSGTRVGPVSTRQEASTYSTKWTTPFTAKSSVLSR